MTDANSGKTWYQCPYCDDKKFDWWDGLVQHLFRQHLTQFTKKRLEMPHA